ncbi:prevacuole/endosomal FYVE tethering component Pep7 [Schizosaccharomyces japonicus yFS275]|uniref:Prevacuole/endosomal FYVE tethering component Pep7 n=1 Tax=Schizosaccharomyces japonicus (strain yFS275 / FY16936) TaxID=402676 RepID=B6K0M9_SCHJY|nr:prevacuole/endosomal FYVE tethering component Pep7 [Schizosaccharomyces japonicus yFS275]EEB07500.1 prevacuole/endosomal FYVE tethering component Pep7 [Schizosaccharomyces japonicus yFS275]
MSHRSPSERRVLGPRRASRVSIQGSSASKETLDSAESSGRPVDCLLCGQQLTSVSQVNFHMEHAHFQNDRDQKFEDIQEWMIKTVQNASKLQSRAVQKIISPIAKYTDEDIVDNFSLQRTKRTDQLVTREHWQPENSAVKCSYPGCSKTLNFLSGRIHCRKCGLVFCHEHTLYQAKLSPSAGYDSKHGIWCRVCYSCFIQRPGYDDTNGTTRSRFSTYSSLRKPIKEKQEINFLLLEKRVKKFENLKLQRNVSLVGNLLFNEERKLEQSIVPWKDDKGTHACPVCKNPFSLQRRRRHCRLCGEVVCRYCVFEISITTVIPSLLICKNCNHCYFEKLKFDMERAEAPPYLLHAQHLWTYREALLSRLHNYNAAVKRVTSFDTITAGDFNELKRKRNKFLQLSMRFHQTALKVQDSLFLSETIERVKNAIDQHAKYIFYECTTMLLPLPRRELVIGIHHRASSMSTMTSQASSSMKSDADEIQEKIMSEKIVFQEQLFLVQKMIEEAKQKRKFDELKTLIASLVPIKETIARLDEQLQLQES